jgi:hypothetical protein
MLPVPGTGDRTGDGEANVGDDVGDPVDFFLEI